ncbi:E3 ubiquitin ligase PQT3-like [Papaver somniferum]|nr:E3 ubiquitin ligase PQT3-like [Papaver somniferum]
MSIYYKFKSGKEFHSIPALSPFMSVLEIKDLIFQTKKFGHGKDSGLILTNPSTNEDYTDDSILIPRNSSVIVCRIPGLPGKSIVVKSKEQEEKEKEDEKIKEICQQTISYVNANDGTTAVNSAHQRGFSNGYMGGRPAMGQRRGLDWRIPPEGYTCHRCKVPGHYIQHCPTNGDPEYDVKRLRPPTGIPKSMLAETADGSYALPGGSVAVLKPNEVAFEKLVEGIPTISRRVIDIPPELHCPMCKDVMRFAVLTSKCCFQSFCDGCIRGNIISKSMCLCGARILVDDLIPNKTIRDTIDRYIESGNTSSGNTKSSITAEDVGTARSSKPKIQAPSLSCTSKTEKIPSCLRKEISDGNENGQSAPSLDLYEDEAESTSSMVQTNAALGQEEVQQQVPAYENFTVDGKPLSPGDLFWGTSQAFGANNCMMPFVNSAYNNPYWSNMQCGMDGFMNPYIGYMGYAAGPYEGMFTQNQSPFGGGPGVYALPCATSQTKKRSRVTPSRGNDWGEDDEERNYKKKQSWQASSVSCHAK